MRHLPIPEDPRVLVAAATRDDAAVFRISDDRALVATVDFFSPIVDDPRAWGAIACANALSDVYAMGGRPLFALNLVGWPRDTLSFDLLSDVLAGAAEVAAEAGCLILGGHSVDDPEPKFGMAVIGEVAPADLMTNAAGHPGDAIILTKPLGTGILTTALKRDRLAEADLAEAIRVMRTLNAPAARVARVHGLRAATDVTGFGLLGHLASLASASNVGARIRYADLPLLAGAEALAAEGVVPGGTRRNLEGTSAVHWDQSLSEAQRLVVGDAQTSGGLLLIVPITHADEVLTDLRAAGTPAQALIGRLTDDPPGTITVTA